MMVNMLVSILLRQSMLMQKFINGPLSAIYARVGKYIIEQSIYGCLKNKKIILVMHQLVSTMYWFGSNQSWYNNFNASDFPNWFHLVYNWKERRIHLWKKDWKFKRLIATITKRKPKHWLLWDFYMVISKTIGRNKWLDLL